MRKSAEEILEESKAALQLYLRSEKDRYKLILVRQATRIFAKSIQVIFAIAFGCIAFCFLFVALALVWGQHLNNYVLGFIYTGLCILGLLVIVLLFSKIFISRPIMQSMLKEVFEDDDEDE
ncbi:hypothetical protein G3O08_18635 [Cryomorpha ignava]|uniref:Phage holin family protein n=1 Tax=Cryomorpha ignava TaxID=101383 RepID=A0A7K3WUZ8_9FLAO|nr:hypothetical protein [Cryomorpha ignava]NEN25513.1 hypothetical protein [Cryomorpha ignava]